MTGLRAAVWVLALLAVGASGANAQTPAAANPLDALKKKNSLSTEDAAQVKTWVTETVTAVGGTDTGAASDAMKALRNGLGGASPAFREIATKATLESIRPAVAGAELEAAVRLVTAAGLLDTAEAASVLVDALKDKRTAVRAAAACSLRRLRPKLVQAGGEFLSQPMRGLTEAGKAETGRYALEAIYRAIDSSEAGSAADAQKALLEILEARKAGWERDQLHADGADLAAITILGKQLRSMDANVAKQYGTLLSGLLRHCVQMYTIEPAPGEPPLYKVRDTDNAELVSLRNAIELLVLEIENQLNTLVGKDAERDLSERLRNADITAVKIAMKAWADVLAGKYGGNYQLRS